MQRFKTSVLALSATVALAGISSGCMATRKFTRNEVKASADTLKADYTAKIDATNGQVKETQDSVNQVNTRVAAVDQRVTTVDQRVTGVDGKVAELDTKTTANINAAKTELNTAVTGVRGTVETTNKNLTSLDQKFQNRNNYAMNTQKSVLFKFDSATLSPENKAGLDEIAQMIMNNHDAILVLEGHTDNTGDRDYNIRLGERRIEAVKRYLAVDKGIPVYRIEQISFGADKPIAPNDSRTNREQNRAVTLSIMTPSGDGAAAAANR